MDRDYPLQDHAYMKCPLADDSIVDFLGKDFPTKMGVQSAILAAAAASLNLWKELHYNQDLCNSADSLIPVTILEAIQKSLVLPPIILLLLGGISSYPRWI